MTESGRAKKIIFPRVRESERERESERKNRERKRERVFLSQIPSDVIFFAANAIKDFLGNVF